MLSDFHTGGMAGHPLPQLPLGSTWDPGKARAHPHTPALSTDLLRDKPRCQESQTLRACDREAWGERDRGPGTDGQRDQRGK